ncbi:MAG: class I SAM-dependent methyltransferase [Cyclobacteriaceae bacterium]
MSEDNFINIPFNHSNLDRYLVRTSIFKALNSSLSQLKGELLDVGCGKKPYKKYVIDNSEVNNYIGLDINTANIYDENVQPDYLWDGNSMPFEKDQFDCAIATEVLEHCPDPDITLGEINRVLKPGGVFFFTVPFLWNLHEIPHDEYRYTPYSLERHLKNSGFINIDIQATGGWHLAMAQMIGLWIRRSPIKKISRYKYAVLKRIAFFLMKILMSISNKEEISFDKEQMITGLYGTAQKP